VERICKDCGDPKPIDLFATYKRAGEVKYLYRCLDCHRIVERGRQRRYIAENREAHNRRSRENKRRRYNTDPVTRDRLKAESAAYYRENREKILAEQRAARRA
jgi:hypothetical protein